MPVAESSREEIPHLGDAYQNGRKAYGLASGLLIAWELIGIEFSASPIESFNITLKSPQAVPYVLVVLILYFGFRFTVEWYQADERRRTLPVSRVDYLVAHLIGASALALYSYQSLRKVQLADLIGQSEAAVLLSGFALGLMLISVIRGTMSLRGHRDRVDVLLIIVQYLGILIAIIASVAGDSLGVLAAGGAFGLGVRWLISGLTHRLFRQRTVRTEQRWAPNPARPADG